jgi:hypothetical protein
MLISGWASPDMLEIPPNAAARARDRTGAAFEAADWDALRALARDDFVFDDRRKWTALTGDIEVFIRNMQLVRAWPNVRQTRELIATVGDRVALERLAWTGGPPGGEFETEYIRLTEVDAAGRLVAFVYFDLADRSAASLEANERFLAGEAAANPAQAVITAVGRAWSRRDWDGLRDGLAPDAVILDHRTLGMGRLDRDRWIASWRAGVDLAPDAGAERPRILAWSRDGRVWVHRVFDTTREGGLFENVFIVVAVAEGDRIRHLEFFDAGDAGRALARFGELGAPAAERCT